MSTAFLQLYSQLTDPDCCRRLQLYLHQRGLTNAADAVRFYQACSEMRQRASASSSAPRSLLRSVRLLYRAHIASPGLELSAATRRAVRARVKAMTEATLDVSVFDGACHEICQLLLDKAVLLEFMRSQQQQLVLHQSDDSIQPQLQPHQLYQEPPLLQSCHSEPTVCRNQQNQDESRLQRSSDCTTDSRRTVSSTKEDFDVHRFHELLTEKLTQLQVHQVQKCPSYSAISQKVSNNAMLMRMIRQCSAMEIDVEEDALRALDCQFSKIGGNSVSRAENNNSKPNHSCSASTASKCRQVCVSDKNETLSSSENFFQQSQSGFSRPLQIPISIGKIGYEK